MARSSNVLLEKGSNYQGTINLNAFQMMASNSQVADEFKSYGFSQVIVTGQGKVREARGVWIKETQQANVPAVVTNIKKVKAIATLG